MTGTRTGDIPLRGIFYVCLAVALISAQKAMAKYLGQNLTMLQVIEARFFRHLLLMVVLLLHYCVIYLLHCQKIKTDLAV